jgi:hypothetical protein
MTELSRLMEIVRECDIYQNECGKAFIDPQGNRWMWTDVYGVLMAEYMERYDERFSDDAYEVASEYIDAWSYCKGKAVCLQKTLAGVSGDVTPQCL